jgi:hypothetical protein
MQPCAACGGVAFSVNGQCIRCGAWAGQPNPASPAYPPYPPGGYPPGGYPTGYPPPPGGNRAKPFVLPLIALSVTLVVLVVAIVIVVVVRDGDPTVPGASPTPGGGPATATGNPDVDPCVVGRWVVTQHREVVAIDNVGRVTFNGGRGGTVDLTADGTGVFTYPAGTAYEGTGNGKAIRLEIEGEALFDYAARNGTMSLRNIRADGTARALVDGDEVAEEPLTLTDDPANYSCLDDTMTIRTAAYTTEYDKTG